MNLMDLDLAATDVRNVVQAAVSRALAPYGIRTILFLKYEEIAKDIAVLAEKCIRELPDRVRLHPHE